MKNKFYLKLMVLLLSISIISCSDDDGDPRPTSISPMGDNGYFIINEGNFGSGDASLSYYNRDSAKVFNDVFSTYIGRPLGDQAQSMYIADSIGFIIVQGSVKIEVININSMTSIATITGEDGLVSPRYFLKIDDDKAYVTDWGEGGIVGTVKIIDLHTYEITNTVSTGVGADKLVRRGDEVYVVNSGGYGTDNTIAVIDVAADEVVKKIEVGANPNSIQLDNNGDLWVSGAGIIEGYDDLYNAISSGYLARIDADDEVDLMVEVEQSSGAITKLLINASEDQLYYNYNGGVYSMSIDDTSLPSTPIFEGSFYGLGVDPVSGNVLAAEAPSFTAAGSAYVYSTSGQEQTSYQVGIGPNGFYFK
ncbi:hypothetical protein LVD15_04550 [Fulvivirga maritima]|uniref:YncE family protein n=1 Tax=Fulvivirga maritima TaxID=2904247 RepID=UPI001F31FDEF|nr:DUF5074 domain-containing protein [Fulvivirga maritima]UII27699.1 hypothetical protein LVD15_04550 [Fulvivirga maritima]